MDPDDDVCVCHHVSLRKLVNYMNRVQPTVPSQLCDCLGAGTGCGWCIPFLGKLHQQYERGEAPQLPVSPEDYARRRKSYHHSGRRDDAAEQGK